MGNRVPRRAPVLVATFLLASLFPSLASQATTNGPGSAASLGPVARYLDAGKRQVKRYWTRERMRSAEPLDMTLEASEVVDLGPKGAGDASEPVTVSGSAPAVPPARLEPRPMSLVEASRQDTSRSESVPPGDPIPYTSGVITDTGVFPNITHGKLFFSDPGVASYVCSGTVVGTESQNVVWTAGHCVTEGDGSGFFTNFLFVPGYDDGVAPEGEWVAEIAVTTSQWKNNTDFRYDVAALTMAPNGSDEEIQEVVGARGISFNQGPDQAYRSIGHPAAPPFDGKLMRFCDSDLGYLDPSMSVPAPMAIGCDMTEGSSGGGWIVEDGETGGGFVHSVNSYGYAGLADTMFGPQLGNVALATYEAAGGDGPPPDTAAPRLTNVVDGPDPFTPLGRKRRATKIKFTLNETARVAFVIKNRAGANVLKVSTSELDAARYYVRWNGRHFKTGKVVKAGTYTYTITATDLAGNTANKSGRVRVKR